MALTFWDNIGAFFGVFRQLTVAELDGNIHTLHLRIKALEDATGKQIDFIEFTGTAIIVHFTDLTTSDPFPLPVATMRYIGLWTNDQPLAYLDVFTVAAESAISPDAAGVYMTLVDHTTPAPPELFDPEFLVGGDLAYMPLFPASDASNDVGFNVMGVLPDVDASIYPVGRLIANHVMVRTTRMVTPPSIMRAFLGTAPELGAVTLAIVKNANTAGDTDEDIGTITFSIGNPVGDINFDDDVDYIPGNCCGLRLLGTDGVAADLSVTLGAARVTVV